MAGFEQQNKTIKPEQIIESIVRYRWLILLPICVCLTIGVFYTLTTQKTYQASTTILIQPQKVPKQYVQSVVSTDIDQRLNTISYQILSSSNLEKIIKEFGLYEDEPEMYLEDKVADMRKRVTVRVETDKSRRSGGNADIFYVFFRGEKPDRVMRIANALASYFMDENLKVREAQAVGTSEFLDSELQKIKLVLETKEKLISEYRSRYLGGLPDELESNLRTLDRLQQQLSDRQSSLRDLNNTLSMVESQIARTKQLQEESVLRGVSVNELGVVQNSKMDTEQLYELEKQKLDQALSQYTQKHPDVVKLTQSVKKLAEKLEAEKLEAEKLEAEKVEPEKIKSNKKKQTPLSIGKVKKSKFSIESENFLFEQQLQIQRINDQIKTHESDIKKIQEAMKSIQVKVQETPQREQELQSLNRDYDNIQQNYNSLLARKLESEIAVNMEKKQKGEQFKILDYARLPQKPISPDIKKIFLFSLALGFGLGGGIAFLFELLNSTIKSADIIETEFGLPLLAVIPSLEKVKKKIKIRLEAVIFSFCFIYAILVLFLFVVINVKGIDKVVSFIKMQINV
ncbi:MAG: GNVR domain-containing protein [Pseudomonadota bacterium]